MSYLESVTQHCHKGIGTIFLFTSSGMSLMVFHRISHSLHYVNKAILLSCGGYEELGCLGYKAKVSRSIGGTCLHFQGWRVTEARSLSSSWRFLASLTLQSWRFRRHVPPKRQLTFNWQHDSISERIVLWLEIIRPEWVAIRMNQAYRTNPAVSVIVN
jgi:hypothetical protein